VVGLGGWPLANGLTDSPADGRGNGRSLGFVDVRHVPVRRMTGRVILLNPELHKLHHKLHKLQPVRNLVLDFPKLA
jgi:hypothetical protein